VKVGTHPLAYRFAYTSDALHVLARVHEKAGTPADKALAEKLRELADHAHEVRKSPVRETHEHAA
jgi:hypothetical protein